MSANALIQTLPNGAYDIVGDVHGEWLPLQALLRHLGYDERGEHPQGRRLVFIGDVCDRGPDSPAVLQWVVRARREHGALCVLGNHEVNILAGDPKDGSAWFFDERMADDEQYQPYQRLHADDKAALLTELASWPLALERDDVRLVHAAWLPDTMAHIRQLDAAQNVAQWYRYFDEHVHDLVGDEPWYPVYQQEASHYEALLGQADLFPAMLPGHAEFELSRWRQNPVRAVVSGSETWVDEPFYAGARWRFTKRSAWWDNYQDKQAVVIGHYWRLWQPQRAQPHRHEDLMPDDGRAWFGQRHNVFCIDFSIGARWRDRLRGVAPSASRFHLAALRWPERQLMMDNGASFATTLFEHR